MAQEYEEYRVKIPKGWDLIAFATEPAKVEEKQTESKPLTTFLFSCSLCNREVTEPSTQSNRSWCGSCEDYVLVVTNA